MSGIPAGAGSLLGKRLGKYEILALLALGGTAEIYLARIGGAAGFEKYVVIKCLHDHLADDQDFVKMFLDEARLAAHLDHSNIVQTFELGEHQNRYYMVMEFLAGLSLAMVVRRAAERLPGGRIPVPLILNIAAQACAGLHYAHERTTNGKALNMVHRDVSPQNVVISFEGVVKIVDFGIARAEMRETKTKAGTIKGKFAYMSPEQCIANNVDRRTDVFALGVIVWELLTGRRLFKRGSPYETYQAVVECNVPVPSSINHELDPALDAIVMKAVAKDKDNRFPTAEALGDALQGYLHHRGKGSGPAEIGRYFDQHFAQEIEEHGGRMRELISGQDASVDTGVTWGADEEKVNETVDLGARGKVIRPIADTASLDLTGGDLLPARSSNSSLDAVIGQIANPSADDEDMPADRTRIEANPLEKLRQLDEASGGRTPVPLSTVTGTSGIAPLPAPPTAPKPIVNVPSGRFPELANLPTQITSETKPVVAAAPIPRGPNSATQHAVMPQGGSPYPVVSGRPVSSDLAPSTYPVVSGRPMSSDLAPSNLVSSQYATGPQQAANLMSPVGDGYPQRDWAAAAALPAKAIPRWMLAALFAGALVAAMLVTLIIAKIIH